MQLKDSKFCKAFYTIKKRESEPVGFNATIYQKEDFDIFLIESGDISTLEPYIASEITGNMFIPTFKGTPRILISKNKVIEKIPYKTAGYKAFEYFFKRFDIESLKEQIKDYFKKPQDSNSFDFDSKDQKISTQDQKLDIFNFLGDILADGIQCEKYFIKNNILYINNFALNFDQIFSFLEIEPQNSENEYQNEPEIPTFEINLKSLKNFNLNDLVKDKKYIFLKSYMGSGKTYVIQKFLEQFKAQESEIRSKIFICSHRSLVQEISKNHKIPTYLNSLDFDGPLENFKENDKVQNIAITFDSLYKLKNTFDIVVLDEFLTTLMRSTDCQNRIQNMRIFEFLLRNAKKVLIADALLTEFWIRFLDEAEIQNSILIENKFRDSTIVQECSRLDIDYTRRFENLEMSISSYSIKNLKAIKGSLDSWNFKENLEIKNNLITAKSKSFKDLENQRVLMFSPAITCGFNIMKKMQVHYHEDCFKSVDIISSIQMLRRSRNTNKILLNLGNYQLKRFKNIKTLRALESFFINHKQHEIGELLKFNDDIDDPFSRKKCLTKFGKIFIKPILFKQFSINNKEWYIRRLKEMFSKVIENFIIIERPEIFKF